MFLLTLEATYSSSSNYTNIFNATSIEDRKTSYTTSDLVSTYTTTSSAFSSRGTRRDKLLII